MEEKPTVYRVFTWKRVTFLTAGLLLVLGFAPYFYAELTGPGRHKPIFGGNRLKNSVSPYLLQHADNPVDWYPWGEEAFRRARELNKPILLSIGYSTCHWCHVMEHESFENEVVAALMNDTFINIKVDREERPDVDAVYMKVAMALNGSGGWPLTVFMTPDKKPFFIASYIPRESRSGRTGMLELIPQVKEFWGKKEGGIRDRANKIAAHMQKAETDGKRGRIDKSVFPRAFALFQKSYDAEHGGFALKPKFPSAHNLLFLLRYARHFKDKKALDMTLKTLEEMRRGGIYDHIGFGFHRYSTDREWLVPHFEKMLYDQALAALAYTEAYLVTGNESFARTAREILKYVKRDMQSPAGGFYSAEDADSEGEEGLFYLWKKKQAAEVLGAGTGDFLKRFQIKSGGNYHDPFASGPHSFNIFHLKRDLGPDELKRWEPLRQRLFEAREKRIHPHKDDKILTDWNGLMIAAFAYAGRSLGEPELIKTAEQGADYILNKNSRKGVLLHMSRGKKSGERAYAGDYAALTWGLLELYQASHKAKYLKEARRLTDVLINDFQDRKRGGFYFTAHKSEKLLLRQRELYDGARPSANSMALSNLQKLFRLTGEIRYAEIAEKTIQAFGGQIQENPRAYGHFLSGLGLSLLPTREIVVVGKPGAADTRAMLTALKQRYLPEAALVFKQSGSTELDQVAPFTKSHKALGGKATAYVCKDFICRRPTSDVQLMLKYIEE